MFKTFKCEHCKISKTVKFSLWWANIKRGKPYKFCSPTCASRHRAIRFRNGQIAKGDSQIAWDKWITICRQQQREYWQERICKNFPVQTLKDMPPEKQQEMKRLYENREVS